MGPERRRVMRAPNWPDWRPVGYVGANMTTTSSSPNKLADIPARERARNSSGPPPRTGSPWIRPILSALDSTSGARRQRRLSPPCLRPPGSRLPAPGCPAPHWRPRPPPARPARGPQQRTLANPRRAPRTSHQIWAPIRAHYMPRVSIRWDRARGALVAGADFERRAPISWLDLGRASELLPLFARWSRDPKWQIRKAVRCSRARDTVGHQIGRAPLHPGPRAPLGAGGHDPGANAHDGSRRG